MARKAVHARNETTEDDGLSVVPEAHLQKSLILRVHCRGVELKGAARAIWEACDRDRVTVGSMDMKS